MRYAVDLLIDRERDRVDRRVVVNSWKLIQRNSNRAELLSVIAELSKLHPEWRLGQMVANLAMAAGRTEAGAVWDLEDGEALAAGLRLLDRHRTHVASPA